ncbi:glycosyltransferase family 4 protein [Rhodococcus sp. (in: high G+C Gram-positive bacteria)]|uniref:glycosyltransferase family 4 protein n=1 Tax=Rhodococcus sp. TaxID=1831 RepID=UPI00388EA778
MGAPLKALFVNENIGGHATVHHSLRRAFAERDDIEVEFLDAGGPGLLGRIMRAPIPGLGRLDLDLQALRGQLVHSRGLRRRLRERLADGEFDVLHVYTQNCMLGSADVVRGLPTVVTTDSTNELNAYLLPYRAATRFTRLAVRAAVRFEQPVLDAALTVVANGRRTAASLTGATYGLSDDKVTTMAPGIWSPFLTGERALPDRTGRARPTIVFIGTSMERKGGNSVLRLHQKYLADTCDLVLVTKDAVPAGRAVTVIDDLTSGDDRLWDILADADLMCFPSGMDQAPNVILEAGAAGLPVIASTVGSIPEMVVDGETGLLVDHDDEDALLAALRLLLADGIRRREMGASAHARIAEHFDIRTTARRLTELLYEAHGSVAAR